MFIPSGSNISNRQPIDHFNPSLNSQAAAEARSASVNVLDGNHRTTYQQDIEREKLIGELFAAQNDDERKAPIAKIEGMKTHLSETRHNTFEIVNSGTNQVYGRLREAENKSGLESYIRQLTDYHLLQTEIQKKCEEKGIEIKKVNDALYIHHSHGVYGDLKNLKALIQGNPGRVPQLSYNQGAIQLG